MEIPNYAQSKPEFTIPTDIVNLPSEGVLYPNNFKQVEIESLTAQDENILTSANLIKNGKVLEVLMEKKIKNLPQGLTVSDLLVGDRNAILIGIRCGGYGNEYTFKVVDPQTSEEFESTIDLSKLAQRNLTVAPDENKLFSFELPKFKKIIKFKLLTGKDEDYITQRAESLKNKINGVIPYLTTRLETQIVSVDGNSNKLYVSEFVRVMPASDSMALRNYIDSVDCGVEMKADIRTPSGNIIKVDVPITTQLFWPNFNG